MDDPLKNNENKKAEILEQNRKSKDDEGMEYADYRGTRIGIILYVVVAFFLVVFSLPDTTMVNAVASLSSAVCVGSAFSYYRFTKKKIYLVSAAAWAVAVIAFALMVILPVGSV